VALIDFVYACPICGGGVREEKEREAVLRCTCCAATLQRERGQDGKGTLHLKVPGREDRFLSLAEVGALLAQQWEGSGVPSLEAEVSCRFSVAELPIRFEGELIGYHERYGPPRAGQLRLEGPRLRFIERERGVHHWPLLDLQSLQGASSQLQITLRGGSVVAFRFRGDSPRRWEEGLRLALRQLWRETGRGEILEFQPRIRGTR